MNQERFFTGLKELCPRKKVFLSGQRTVNICIGQINASEVRFDIFAKEFGDEKIINFCDMILSTIPFKKITYDLIY